jgi:hypothetical protein
MKLPANSERTAGTPTDRAGPQGAISVDEAQLSSSGGRFCSVVSPELQIDVGSVALHSPARNEQPICDLHIGVSGSDLGKDVELEKFVEEQLRTNAEIVCLSA